MQPGNGRVAGWDGHVLLVHATERERRAGVAAWLRRGLELNAKIVYVEPIDAPPERSLSQQLVEEQLDVAAALARGQLELVDPRAGIGSAWQVALVQRGLREGYPAVCLGGEAGTSTSVMSPMQLADAESEANELCRTLPVSILCQYSTSVSPSAMERACAMHAAGVRGATFRAAPIQGGIAVAGEVDLSNAEILRSAVAAACARGRQQSAPVVIELAELTFLDVAAARALVTGTSAHRADGGAIELRGAPPGVDRLLRQLGVDQVPGLILEVAS